jgi:site-specific DNA recombinase
MTRRPCPSSQQQPKYLLTGKMTCRGCSANYAKSGKSRFRCQGSARRVRLIAEQARQDDLDGRLISRLTSEMMREEVLTVFIEEHTAETRRLENASITGLPKREAELALVNA